MGNLPSYVGGLKRGKPVERRAGLSLQRGQADGPASRARAYVFMTVDRSFDASGEGRPRRTGVPPKCNPRGVWMAAEGAAAACFYREVDHGENASR